MTLARWLAGRLAVIEVSAGVALAVLGVTRPSTPVRIAWGQQAPKISDSFRAGMFGAFSAAKR